MGFPQGSEVITRHPWYAALAFGLYVVQIVWMLVLMMNLAHLPLHAQTSGPLIVAR